MNKRQPTLLQEQDASLIEPARKGNSVRRHVLDKASTLSRDIASLNDPNISHFYDLLTAELQQPRQSAESAQSDKSVGASEKISTAKALDSAASTTEVAAYVHNIAKELKDICLSVDLKFLAYLVDMVRVEANSILIQQAGVQNETSCPAIGEKG